MNQLDVATKPVVYMDMQTNIYSNKSQYIHGDPLYTYSYKQFVAMPS